MDPLEITRLAKHLRESGDKVLNSNFKLTLSGGFHTENFTFLLASIIRSNEIHCRWTFTCTKRFLQFNS